MKKRVSPTYRDYLLYLAAYPHRGAQDYGITLQEIELTKVFAQYSSTFVFILDYATKSYPYADPSALQVSGHTNEAFYEGGLEFVLHNNPDFNVLNQNIYPDRTEFLDRHPDINLSQLRFTMNLSLRHPSGTVQTILQRNTVIHSADNQLPIAILGFAWNVTDQMTKGKFIQQIEQLNPQTGTWQVLLSKEYYPNVDRDRLLSKREIEILKWVVEGYSSKQIADKLHLSLHTVNTHRKNMLSRTNSANAMELRLFAEGCGLL